MANSAQARKRARQAVKQNAHNSGLRSEMRTAIKKVIKAIEAGDKAVAQSVYQASVSTVDSIADKKDHTQEQGSSSQEPSVCCNQGDGITAAPAFASNHQADSDVGLIALQNRNMSAVFSCLDRVVWINIRLCVKIFDQGLAPLIDRQGTVCHM